MTLLETLVAARALIADEVNWTQGAYAREAPTKKGMPLCSVSPLGADARCFCSLGALARAHYGERVWAFGWSIDEVNTFANPLREAIRRSESYSDLATFNDTHTHAEVLALWDDAIAHERSKQNENQ